VQYGANRQEYASRLVDIAELSSAPIAAAGVGIVSLRSMLARRVERILDTSRKLSTHINHRLLAVVLTCGLLGTTVVGLVGVGSQTSQAETESVAGESKKQADNANDNASDNTKKASLASSRTAANTSQQFEGKVVDPMGTPVDGAQLYLVFHVPQATGLLAPIWKPVASTDATGAFRFRVHLKDFGVNALAREFGYRMLVAVKEGFGFAWSRAGKYETSGEWLRKARVQRKKIDQSFSRNSINYLLASENR